MGFACAELSVGAGGGYAGKVQFGYDDETRRTSRRALYDLLPLHHDRNDAISHIH